MEDGWDGKVKDVLQSHGISHEVANDIEVMKAKSFTARRQMAWGTSTVGIMVSAAPECTTAKQIQQVNCFAPFVFGLKANLFLASASAEDEGAARSQKRKKAGELEPSHQAEELMIVSLEDEDESANHKS